LKNLGGHLPLIRIPRSIREALTKRRIFLFIERGAAPPNSKREASTMEARENVSSIHPHNSVSQSSVESLKRAVSGQSVTNFPAIFQGFAAKGIPETEIKPRENVFTFDAWKALGRVVRRGEHGVKVTTFVESKSKEIDEDTGERKTFRRPWTTTVFHVSQTEPLKGGGR
jgi:hypothetical protein